MRSLDIAARLADAEIVPLSMSLVHLTGDVSVLDALEPYVRGPWEHQISVPPALAASVRRRVTELLAIREIGHEDRQLSHSELHRMMRVVAGEEVEESYVPMLIEQALGSEGRERRPCPSAAKRAGDRFRVLIIGAGASGICAAIRLGQCGIPYTILEKNGDVGGTWYENRYPGCAVDLPSHHYEYSFEPYRDWPHYYSRQPSVLDYFRHCADKYDVRRHVRFGVEVHAAHYDDARGVWNVRFQTAEGQEERCEANVVLCAVGQLNRPLIPTLEGLTDFRGPAFHTAAWPDDAQVRGRRVGLIGTGPSAVQVGPAIASDVAALYVFQRSGSWVARRPNIGREVSESTKWLFRNVPFYASWYRVQLLWAFGDGILQALRIDPEWQGGLESVSELNAKHRASMLRYMERELEGRADLLRKVIPKYPPFAKRVIADPGWYRMLRRENVELIDEPIARIEPDGIRTASGRHCALDSIVFATGFQADRMLGSIDVVGRNRCNLRELWGKDNPRAYLGLTVPGFPNFFTLYGPNSNFAHGGSAIFLAECQVNYIVELLHYMATVGYATAEVRRDVHDRYNAMLDEQLSQLAWSHPSVKSWYRNAAGRIVTNQPWRLVDYWHMTRKPQMTDFFFRGTVQIG